ncbi:RNA-binding cell elongation regulator Jag/EloR [Tenuibacillus multivorans]|uniref:RNA-binding protein KhpB n=1 Tax=Tenuibacillus multivorans TaxID=237069 RepID=A0A1G9W656_9BACI|nr:RNA-binding cell elongation regulator Jag/EloR [Tenuibacillus multivorans]GEL76326.1 Jag protein [Tenuibacillus multivorans]SDM79969.1 spoIIIJ-associated protein [Tenuibacillus multivorans]
MREITASGQTVEEAKENALRQLGLMEDQVNVEVIDEGKKGILGVFGSKRAYVKVQEKVDLVKVGEQFLVNVTNEMGVNVEVQTTEGENEIVYELVGEKIGLLIGKRGQTLNALQYLTHLAVNKIDQDQYVTVVVDAENYRYRREETLSQLANKLAYKVMRNREAVKIEPMPSFERKIIHTALHDHSDVSTHSEGKDPNRYVVIKPKEE